MTTSKHTAHLDIPTAKQPKTKDNKTTVESELKTPVHQNYKIQENTEMHIHVAGGQTCADGSSGIDTQKSDDTKGIKMENSPVSKLSELNLEEYVPSMS